MPRAGKFLGEILLRMGEVTQPELEFALARQREQEKIGTVKRSKLGDTLIQDGYLITATLVEGLRIQELVKGGKVADAERAIHDYCAQKTEQTSRSLNADLVAFLSSQ